MDTLNVVCFLWHGDRWNNRDDGVLYVNTLYSMVKRNLSLPFRFICFTDLDVKFMPGVEKHRFVKPSTMGVLPRIFMFSPDAHLTGQVLALDLDIIITGSIDEIASYRGDFCVRSKFKAGEEHKADGDIIGFNAEKCTRIWEYFRDNKKWIEETTEGRERYFYRQACDCTDRWQDLFPSQVVSYKRHVRLDGLPENARIVSCHGRPRPHEINETWAVEAWR